MKKIKFLALAAVLSLSIVSVTSCSSDDSTQVNEQQQQQVTLEGKWYFSKDGTSIMGVEYLHDWQHEQGCSKDHKEFIPGGVFKDRRYYTGCEVDERTYSWVKEGNNITVDMGAMLVVYEIVNLTATELKVRTPHTSDGDIYQVTVFTRS